MPKYEYKCKDCGERFEEEKKIEEYDSKSACPKCESQNTQRIFDFAALFGINRGDSCGPARHT
ncbi:zinc ribbon domain-containing protein [Chloroflexota bacterium]